MMGIRKVVIKMYSYDGYYVSPEKGLELAEREAEDATLILAFAENVRECIRKLPEGLTQRQRKKIFVTALEAVSIENMFFSESELIKMSTSLSSYMMNCCCAGDKN